MIKKLQLIYIAIIAISLSLSLVYAQDNARDNETELDGSFIYQINPNPGPVSPAGVLFDNGPAFNVAGGGPGGADLSLLENTTLGMTTLGFGHQVSAGNRIADDFTATEEWTIDSIWFYAYQTNGGIPSTITAVNLQIWDGSPDGGASVVWGDATTNVMTYTEWSNIYRHSETAPGTARAIMKNTVTVGTTLPAGTYWLDWQSDGSAASGPWAPPVVILGQTTTGDALQWTGAWAPALDGGTATPQGFPFVIFGTAAAGTITIAEAIEDLNNDLIPDRLGQTVTVQGVVFSPNFQSSNNSYYIDDGTAGTNIFMFGPPVFDWALGDELQITGEVAQFNGMTEIIPADSTGWVLMSTGNPTPDPIVLTLAQYKADPEAYEGSLVGFISLDLVGGTWPASGSTNLQLSDGADTVTFRIDSDTDIPGQPEPVWPQDVIGIGSQFCSGGCVDDGYQIFPRFYDTDFLPPGTIPVELTSFTAQVNDGVVSLNWITATEQNNQGFEVQRRTDGDFITIGFVNGYGTTTEVHNYSFTDSDVQVGTYYYRLKQVDYNGTFEYLDVVQVDVVAPANFSLEQNYPNPFNPSTIITFGLAIDSKVSLKVFDVLGQEVVSLITSNMTAGVHEINFDASNLNSGVYFYRINAAGVDGTNFTSVKKMILTK